MLCHPSRNYPSFSASLTGPLSSPFTLSAGVAHPQPQLQQDPVESLKCLSQAKTHPKLYIPSPSHDRDLDTRPAIHSQSCMSNCLLPGNTTLYVPNSTFPPSPKLSLILIHSSPTKRPLLTPFSPAFSPSLQPIPQARPRPPASTGVLFLSF